MSNRPVFSVISVYTDRQTVEEVLQSGLESEPDSLYESILIDNRDGEFDSAAAALNSGAKRASGRYLLFIHQDVELLGERWLERAAELLDSIDDLGVAGLTGMVEEGGNPFEKGRNVIRHGDDRREWRMGRHIDRPTRVQTIDELAIIVPKEVHRQRGFNEAICDGWHLYAVEYALYHRHRTELDTYVLPLEAWHVSTGMPREPEYYETLRSIASVYPEAESISTTCGTWPNDERYLAGVHRALVIIASIAPPSISSRVVDIWPAVWGGGIPLLWREGIQGLPAILREIQNR